MKKILLVLLSCLLLCVSSPIYAKDSNTNESADPSSAAHELSSNSSPYITQYIISDDTGEHIIKYNSLNYELTIDGSTIKPTITQFPTARATIDYGSRMNLQYSIPWRGAAVMTAALVAAIPGIGWTVAGAIIGGVAAEGSPLYVTYTQYHSAETYRSQSSGIYYKKAINKYIRAYKNSISRVNLIYGPADGGWFDPIQP